MTDKMPDYSKFSAVYQPTRLDDLRPEVKQFIGQTLNFSYAWTMDEDDPYPDEIAYSCRHKDFPYWVPERDIRRLAQEVG